MHDDDATRDALGLIEAYATGNRHMLAPVVAHMTRDELRLVLLKLAAFVDLRVKVGAQIESTAEWARWLRHEMPDLIV